MKRSFLVLLSLVVFSTASWASKETFSGTMCESLYNINSPYGKDIAYSGGSIVNRSSVNWGYIDCPVPRANGLSSGTIADLEVSVEDTDGNMWCTAYNRDRYGNTVASETVNSIGTGDRVLDFNSVAGTAYEGHITVFCVLPKSYGKIHSISVDIN